MRGHSQQTYLPEIRVSRRIQSIGKQPDNRLAPN